MLRAQVELCVMSLVARYDVFHALSSLHPSLTLAVPTPHPHTHIALHFRFLTDMDNIDFHSFNGSLSLSLCKAKYIQSPIIVIQ